MNAKVSKMRICCLAFVIQHTCLTNSSTNAFIPTNYARVPSLIIRNSQPNHSGQQFMPKKRNRRRLSSHIVWLSSQSNDDDYIRQRYLNGMKKQQQRQKRDQKKQMRNKLESSLSDLFDISQGTMKQKKQRQSDLLEKIGVSDKSAFSNAPKLDESVYLNSDKYMDEDGSFSVQTESKIADDMESLRSVLMNESPSIPLERETNSKSNNATARKSRKAKQDHGNIIDDQALLESLGDAQKHAESAMDGDELHRRVFANERGFLDQSDAFQNTLTSVEDDESKQKENEAVAWRRGADYRRRQEEAMALIEKEMEELENSAMSIEDARKLAAEDNQSNADSSSEASSLANYHSSSDSNINGGGNIKATTILCSKCSSLMTTEEIAMERTRGRTSSNQMICRFCQVDARRIRNSSPYLSGRMRKNGTPMPRMGLDELEPSTNKTIRRNVEKIRNMSPRTEDLTTEEIRAGMNSDDPSPNGGIRRTEAEAAAWREDFISAMSQRRTGNEIPARKPRNQITDGAPEEIPTDRSTISKTLQKPMNNVQVGASKSTSKTSVGEVKGSRNQMMPTKSTNQNKNRGNHRYSGRLQFLQQNQNRNGYNEVVWKALHKAASYRQQCATVGQSSRTNPPSTSSGANNESIELRNARNKIQKLEARLKELEGIAHNYKRQAEDSSRQVEGLRSLIAGMNKHKKPVRKESSPKQKNGKKHFSLNGQSSEEAYLEDP